MLFRSKGVVVVAGFGGDGTVAVRGPGNRGLLQLVFHVPFGVDLRPALPFRLERVINSEKFPYTTSGYERFLEGKNPEILQ